MNCLISRSVVVLACAALFGCKPAAPGYAPIGSHNTTSHTTTVDRSVANKTTAGSDAAVESTAEAERPPAEETPSATHSRKGSDGEVERITFDDLNCGIQADLVFREWMLTDRAKELDGQRVRLAGYILADLKVDGIDEFVLLKNTECKFGPGGQADHLALVKLKEGVSTSFTSKPIDVIGTLRYKPFTGIDGFTWAIYEIEGERVQPMRR